MVLVLFGCWQPGDYLPPQPEGLAAAVAPGGADVAPEGEAGDDPPDADAEADADEGTDRAAAAVDPYGAHTLGSPLTLVDDVGAVVQVLPVPNTAVTVLEEEPGVRRRVRCDGCTPVVEGWLQWDRVER